MGMGTADGLPATAGGMSQPHRAVCLRSSLGHQRGTARAPCGLAGGTLAAFHAGWPQVFSASARAHADKPCLGWRPLDSSGKAGPFCWMDYAGPQPCSRAPPAARPGGASCAAWLGGNPLVPRNNRGAAVLCRSKSVCPALVRAGCRHRCRAGTRAPRAQQHRPCCAETLQQAADVGSALTAAGVRKGGRCAIFSINTPQWMITMQVSPHTHVVSRLHLFCCCCLLCRCCEDPSVLADFQHVRAQACNRCVPAGCRPLRCPSQRRC